MNNEHTHHSDLSSLLDGALDADRTRFLLRRLQHDGELAGSLSRWQLAGDALRGQAHAPAPAGFAERVAARIAIEDLPLDGFENDVGMPRIEARPVQGNRATPRRPATGARLRWFGGGALAASLAMAVVWNARDGVIESPPAAAPRVATVAQAPQAEAASASQVASMPAAQTEAATNTGALQMASATPARVASTVPERRTRVVARAAATTAPVADPVPAIELPPANPASTRMAQADAPKAAETKPVDPFQPPAARAWPKASIPGVGQGTFSASLDASADSPFAPPPRNAVPVQRD